AEVLGEPDLFGGFQALTAKDQHEMFGKRPLQVCGVIFAQRFDRSMFSILAPNDPLIRLTANMWSSSVIKCASGIPALDAAIAKIYHAPQRLGWQRGRANYPIGGHSWL
ncbi:MAG: hypothetical protein ACR2PG_22925, partial [Hyphomicrobiaceae bacterium]